MGLTRLRLKNFKCFADSGEIPLAPLTVIFGRNNTGKSSILQSLLLLRQTIESPEYGQRLNMRGPLYPAGGYSDLVHQHKSDQHIVISFGVQLPEADQEGDIELEFAANEPQPPRLTRLNIKLVNLPPLEIRAGRGAGGPYELKVGDHQLGTEKKGNFIMPANSFLPLFNPQFGPVGGPATSPFRKCMRSAPHLLGMFEQTLATMRAVGAFRQQPSRRYEFQGRVPESIDSAGENVVNALIEDSTRRRNRGALLASVNRWLKAVGRVKLLSIRRISRSARIYEIRLKDTDSGRWANFADVGFGIGQAFPVFVEGLRTPEHGTFLVQEPEIHLHPDAQLGMADFLISLVRSGRRVIVETHSEHILLRIRHAVLASQNGRFGVWLRPDETSIVFVTKHPEGASQTQILPIDKLGQIKNWPAGFMGEATEERMTILRAQAAHVEAANG